MESNGLSFVLVRPEDGSLFIFTLIVTLVVAVEEAAATDHASERIAADEVCVSWSLK
jgi:hypothetical protein